ncbi:MAG TPA: DUF885 domain-containing protein [Longimicrobiales bacterium]|nr:DUF885 domain-containing protein [Longimicrobiales bacterium]
MRSIIFLPVVFLVLVSPGLAQDSGEMAICRRELWNISPLTGWQNNPNDAATEIANLRKGLQLGYVASRYNVERTIALVKTMQTRRPSAETKRYVDFLQREYLPHARKSAGVYGLPNGRACFNALIHRYTSASINSNQLDSIAHDLRKRAAQLPSPVIDAPLRFSTTNQVLAHADSLLKRAMSAVPQWFAAVPNEPAPRVAIWPDADPNGASAIYIPASDTSEAKILINAASVMGGEGGLYLDRLIFHESVPGHHLQAIYAKHARKAASATPNTAFVEGWAVYASNLADEMGLYTSETTRAPVNNSLMDDAVTFLVQAGLHVHRWTPKQAVDTIVKLSGVPREEADQQVQYFLAAPAHALAYPVGARTIEQLRNKAMRHLGAHFDIKQFHRIVLERGPMPLSELTKIVDQWIRDSD